MKTVYNEAAAQRPKQGVANQYHISMGSNTLVNSGTSPASGTKNTCAMDIERGISGRRVRVCSSQTDGPLDSEQTSETKETVDCAVKDLLQPRSTVVSRKERGHFGRAAEKEGKQRRGPAR